MTRQEFYKLCESLGFYKQIRVGSLAYYAGLNSATYFGPTLIYLPEEENKAYISPAIKIYEDGDSLVYKHGIKIPGKEGPFNMTKIYPSYNLSDDKAIEHALFNLQKMLKGELNRIKKEKINGDFK